MRCKLRTFGVSLMTLALLSACSRVPDGILSEKEMQRVMTDMLIAESMVNVDYNNYKTDSLKMALYESVFRKHSITQAVYDSSLVWYGRNLDTYMKVYDRVLADLNNRITDLGDVQADATSSSGDSVDIWSRRPYLTLSPRSVFNGVTFDIRPEVSYASGSTFVLGMNVWGLDSRARYMPEIRLSADQGDTTIIVNDKITRDGYHETVLKTLPTKKVKRVFGYIRMDSKDTTYYKVYIDSLSLMKYNYGKEIDLQPKDSIN